MIIMGIIIMYGYSQMYVMMIIMGIIWEYHAKIMGITWIVEKNIYIIFSLDLMIMGTSPTIYQQS